MPEFVIAADQWAEHWAGGGVGSATVIEVPAP